MARNVTLEGLTDLVKGFKEFREGVEKRKITGQKLAANEFKSDVQGKITEIGLYKKGDYRRSIHAEGPFTDAEGTYFLVGTNRIDARQHEFGGIIKAKNGPYLIFKIGDQWIQTKQIYQPPHPHFRPALDENKEKYARIMAEATFGS